MLKSLASMGAAVGLVALLAEGCALQNGVITPSPAAASDITEAYVAICGSTATPGLLAAAQPFASVGGIATYYNEAVAICANGAPTNEVVAGFDIFEVYLDLSKALSAKSAKFGPIVAHAKMLKAKAHRG